MTQLDIIARNQALDKVKFIEYLTVARMWVGVQYIEGVCHTCEEGTHEFAELRNTPNIRIIK